MREKEHIEGVRLMRWARGAQLKWPCLKWLYHIPNGGLRNRVVAGKLKAEGVKAGVSDYFLPWPMMTMLVTSEGDYEVPKYLGLYLELKALGHTYCTPDQKEFLADMAAAGYAVAWRRGASDCIDVITAYLEGTWENETD